MTLRLRLLLGYWYLVALLLVATGSAVLSFLHLSAGIDRVLKENYRSIRVAMDMLESLERQDSATLSALLFRSGVPDEMEALEIEFAKALDTARGNITEAPEVAVLEEIATSWAKYRSARHEFVTDPSARPLADYNQGVYPLFVATKRGVRALLEINQEAMFVADQEAKATAQRSGAWLGFVVALALVSLLFLSRALQHQLLSRIDRLRHEVPRMATGQVQRRLREEGSDELGAIARGINALLDRQQKQRGEAEARLAQERRLLVSFLESCHERGALYDLAGRLRAGHGSEVPREVVRWIREEGKSRIGSDTAAERTLVEGFEVRLLATAPDRPAGWLVHPV